MEFLQTTLCYLEKGRCLSDAAPHQKKNDVNHDKWVGVGGKFEGARTRWPAPCAEVREETGLTMRTPQYRGIVDFTVPVAGRADAPVHLHGFLRRDDRL